MGADMKKLSFLAKSTSLISYQYRSKKILRLMQDIKPPQTTDSIPHQAENNRRISRVEIHSKTEDLTAILNLNQRQEILRPT